MSRLAGGSLYTDRSGKGKAHGSAPASGQGVGTTCTAGQAINCPPRVPTACGTRCQGLSEAQRGQALEGVARLQDTGLRAGALGKQNKVKQRCFLRATCLRAGKITYLSCKTELMIQPTCQDCRGPNKLLRAPHPPMSLPLRQYELLQLALSINTSHHYMSTFQTPGLAVHLGTEFYSRP